MFIPHNHECSLEKNSQDLNTTGFEDFSLLAQASRRGWGSEIFCVDILLHQQDC